MYVNPPKGGFLLLVSEAAEPPVEAIFPLCRSPRDKTRTLPEIRQALGRSPPQSPPTVAFSPLGTVARDTKGMQR
jgi:hypothetical protein